MDADITHFTSIPWTASLLSSPDIILSPMESRKLKPSTEDAFFSQTLSTPHTITHALTFYTRPSSPSARINTLNCLITLGYAVNGYPNVAHGGLVATILDETMGLLLHGNKVRSAEGMEDVNSVTAYLNVSYLKEVPTPGTILVTAELKRVEGRKSFIESSVRDERGVVLARAEALFIGVRRREEKL